jgi:TolB-like protein/Flp pilus assembly protein TadD
LLSGSLAFLKYAKSDRFQESVQPPITSLAVLPFKPLTGESADPSLQLGMADGVITRLSNLKELTVRPTSAVSRYIEQTADLAAVGRELKVDSVLDGTIQRAGDRLRISVQLIRSLDGKPIWAEHFDERATDIFALQDSLSERVARALAIKLTGNESTRLQQHYTADIEAYQSYLKGRYQMNMATEGALKAVASFQNAIDRDPNFALAYTGLADAYSLLGFVGIGTDSPGEQFNKARAAATRALELDDSLADAHTQLANVLFSYDWKWEEAEREFKYAIELNPNSAQAHHLYSEYLQAMTRWDEGLEEIKRAHELDPLSLPINFHYALCLSTMGRDDEALEQYRKTLDIDPNTGASGSHWGIAMIYLKREAFDDAIRELELAQQADPRPSFRALNLAQAYARAGRRKEAMSNLGQILQIQKTSWVSPSGLAMVYDALGDKDQAVAWWNKAIDEREASVVYLKAMPIGDIRKDPRYLDLLKRVGLDF